MIEFVGIRMTDFLKKELQRESDALDITVSQYIRAVLYRSLGSGECRDWVRSLGIDKNRDLIAEVEKVEHKQTDKYHIF